MSQSRGKRAKRTSNYGYVYISYEVQPFNLDDYVQNPAMIMKLYEEVKIVRAALNNLQLILEETKSDNQGLELQKQELEIKLVEAKREIERLQEDKKTTIVELNSLKSQSEELKSQNHKLEMEKREIDIELRGTKQKVDEISRASLLKYAVSLAAAIVLGFGVNIVTSSPYDWKGWLIITLSIILAVIAFFVPRKGS